MSCYNIVMHGNDKVCITIATHQSPLARGQGNHYQEVLSVTSTGTVSDTEVYVVNIGSHFDW